MMGNANNSNSSCLYFRVKATKHMVPDNIVRCNCSIITFKGRPSSDTFQSTSPTSDINKNRKRIRGHLPDPQMTFGQGGLGVEGEDAISFPVQWQEELIWNRKLNSFRAFGHIVSSSGDGQQSVPGSLDMHASRFRTLRHIRTGGRGQVYHQCRSLHKVLQDAIFGGFSTLLQLNMRHCSSLQRLSIPSSLVALDCGYSEQLKQILCPLITKDEPDFEEPHYHLKYVNFNGCRNLQTLGGPSCRMNQFALHIRELDLSSCSKLPEATIVDLLQNTQCLETLSLRNNVATDTIVEALATSKSASDTLTLVDFAFSYAASLTDVSVNRLVEQGVHLQQLNLRGCKGVSSQCYNITPIVLLQRQQQRKRTGGDVAPGGDDDTITTASYSKHARKGDSVFFFVSSQEPKPAAKK